MNEDSRRSQLEYGHLGAEYAVRTEINAFNSAFERPAIKALIGDPAGLRVLDAACAGGTLSEWLIERRAQVVALDITPEMASHARHRLPDRATVLLADLALGLPIANSVFDLIVSSFTLHYLRDWQPVLREFRRALRPTGALVVSTHHPSSDVRLSASGDYFATELLEDTWTGFSETPIKVHFYRRPLCDMSEALYDAGFLIERIEERAPREFAAFKEESARVAKRPVYLFVRAIPR